MTLSMTNFCCQNIGIVLTFFFGKKDTGEPAFREFLTQNMLEMSIWRSVYWEELENMGFLRRQATHFKSAHDFYTTTHVLPYL